MVLWCYFVWYAFVVVRYFDSSLTLWGTSVGLSGIIGTGLYLSTAYAGERRARLGFWPVFRFYLMPFCVSSFAALIKGHGFLLIFHPNLRDNVAALSLLRGAFARGCGHDIALHTDIDLSRLSTDERYREMLRPRG